MKRALVAIVLFACTRSHEAVVTQEASVDADADALAAELAKARASIDQDELEGCNQFHLALVAFRKAERDPSGAMPDWRDVATRCGRVVWAEAKADAGRGSIKWNATELLGSPLLVDETLRKEADTASLQGFPRSRGRLSPRPSAE